MVLVESVPFEGLRILILSSFEDNLTGASTTCTDPTSCFKSEFDFEDACWSFLELVKFPKLLGLLQMMLSF